MSSRCMSDFLAPFAAYLRDELMLEPSTRIRYEHVLKDFAEFAESQALAPAEARRDDLLHYLRAKSAAGTEPSKAMWNLRLAALRTFFKYLLEEDVVHTNPATPIERRTLTRKERLPLSLDEMLALVDAADEHSPKGQKARNVAIFQVLLHCSLRTAELVSLTVDRLTHRRVRGRPRQGRQGVGALQRRRRRAVERYIERSSWGLFDTVRVFRLAR